MANMNTLHEQHQFNILTGGEPGLLVNGGWNMGGGGGGAPNRPTPGWDKGWPPKPKPQPAPKPNMTIAHHTGGKHFTEPTGPELIQDVLNDPTLDESDYERILGPDYNNKIQQYQQQSMLISGVPYTGGGWMLNNGGFVNSAGEAFRQNRDGSFDYLGPYTEDRFGPLIPGGGPDRA